MAQAARSAQAPLHPGFVGAAAILFIAALATDYLYYSTSLWQWANFSAWLIAGGLVLALLAGIFLAVDLLVRRVGPISWVRFTILALAALLALINMFIHTRDGWTSVVPEGILLSAAVSILLLATSVRGWSVTGDRRPREGGRR